MSLVAVSKHLNVLEKARLISRSKRGSSYYVRLEPIALKPARDWFLDYEAFWTDRIEALTNLLEEKTDEDRSSEI